ncbi:MAG: undecaprenyl-phosphate glucose phosphotransferase [Planctomycetota bacterium]
MVKQRHQIFVALMTAVDAAAIASACLASWALRRHFAEGWFPKSWENWFKEPLVFFAIPVTLYAMSTMGLYRARRDKGLFGEQWGVLKASALAIAAMVVVLFLVGNDAIGQKQGVEPVRFAGMVLEPGRFQILTLAVILPLVLGAERLGLRLFLRAARARGRNLRHVAVIGVGRLGQICARTIDRNSWTGIKVAFFLSHEESTRRTRTLGVPVLGGLGDLEATLERNPVDAIYVCLPNARAAKLSGVLQRLERFHVDVRIVPDVPLRYTPANMVISELDGMPILSCRESPQLGLGGASKRALDIAGAIAAMLLFAPVFIACWIAVRLSGPGKVIFKQRRVSFGGQTFKIYKFRTMYSVDDERYPVIDESALPAGGWTDRNDPRITPVGRFMRRASLDELPQLLNVLKGQMSLVGPRPERPELIERFRDDWRGYMLRQHVKAGMTGWAQVNGMRGDTSLKKRLQYDLHYIKNWSIWFDVRILVITVFKGFIHKNAH